MKRKLTIQVRIFRHACTLQNICRPHVIKTIKAIMSTFGYFGRELSGLAKKWLRLVEKGSGSQARTIATPRPPDVAVTLFITLFIMVIGLIGVQSGL